MWSSVSDVIVQCEQMFEGATCGHTVEYTVVSLSVQKYRTEVEYTNIELWISEHCNGQQIVH